MILRNGKLCQFGGQEGGQSSPLGGGLMGVRKMVMTFHFLESLKFLNSPLSANVEGIMRPKEH